MKNDKFCFDCFHCKVSAKSTEKSMLCFCSVIDRKENRKKSYWKTKQVCEKFDDVTDDITLIFPVLKPKRRPLLRKRENEYL